MRNQNIIKYAWTRNGNVFIRKDDTEPSIKIEHISQLQDSEEFDESSENEYETDILSRKQCEDKETGYNQDITMEAQTYKDRMRPHTTKNEQSTSKSSSNKGTKYNKKASVK